MSYARLHTACVSAATVVPILVEVDIQPGLPVFSIIGLPDKGLEEARQRVRSAIRNSGFPFPMGRVTVNLSPSHLRKQGSSFDLPIALGILAAMGTISEPSPDMWVLGELGLEGEVRSASRLAAVLVGALHRRQRCLVPLQEEASLVPECATSRVASLAEAVAFLRKGLRFSSAPAAPSSSQILSNYSLDSVRGQGVGRRALEIAVAGGHSLLLAGPPGTGKTMLAKAGIQLLPAPSREEALQMLAVRSLAGLPLREGVRPFREPHHTLSAAALLGGAHARPGELTLAHGGVLFLDELPHFPRATLEALRQPMQDRQVRLTKHGVEYSYPADCLIIAAQNYCPCGLLGAEGESCRCSARDLVRYRQALSEPLLDRFELFCDVPRPAASEVFSPPDLSGSVIHARILKARAAQASRAPFLNARLGPDDLLRGVILGESLTAFVTKAADSFHLSVRGLESLLKVSRTIADLAGEAGVALEHVQEAMQYRRSHASLV